MRHVVYITMIAGAALFALIPVVHAAEEDPAKNLALILDGACDPKNSKLFVESKHPTKTIVATLRWSLSGSKRVASDVFQIAPGTRVEIGCAAQADIVSAQYTP
jgi:hypothetical protein